MRASFRANAIAGAARSLPSFDRDDLQPASSPARGGGSGCFDGALKGLSGSAKFRVPRGEGADEPFMRLVHDMAYCNFDKSIPLRDGTLNVRLLRVHGIDYDMLDTPSLIAASLNTAYLPPLPKATAESPPQPGDKSARNPVAAHSPQASSRKYGARDPCARVHEIWPPSSWNWASSAGDTETPLEATLNTHTYLSPLLKAPPEPTAESPTGKLVKPALAATRLHPQPGDESATRSPVAARKASSRRPSTSSRWRANATLNTREDRQDRATGRPSASLLEPLCPLLSPLSPLSPSTSQRGASISRADASVSPQLAPPPSRQRRASFSPAEANVGPLPALYPRSCVSAEHPSPPPRAAAPSTHAPPQLPASLSLHRVPLPPSPTAAFPLPIASRHEGEAQEYESRLTAMIRGSQFSHLVARQQRSKPRAPASSPTCSPRMLGLPAVAE